MENKKPLFTKKHYKAITEMLSKVYEKDLERYDTSFWKLNQFLCKLIQRLELDNKNFDEDKFRKAIEK